MQQPIPRKIKEEKPELIKEKSTYTLLIDGNSLLEISFHGDKRLNSRGEHVGGIFQFLLQLKILLSKGDFDSCYVFWDGDNSGEYRAHIYPEYKANRDKNYSFENSKSEYYKQMDDFVKNVLNKQRLKKEKTPEKLNEKESFHRQKRTLEAYLEELFIRQVSCNKIEGDDLIAYYCLHKKPNDKVVIVSGDRDLTQLIDEDICLYEPRLKKFISTKNHIKEIGYHHKNVLVKKIITGDISDNIKGVKGVGEKTLFELIPEIKEKEITLNDVIEKCKVLNKKRIEEKKKPLSSYENIINGVTDGIHRGKLYEINEKIINLKKPILDDESTEMMNDMMYIPIDCDDRGMNNLYKMIIRDDIFELIDSDKFANFFSIYNKIIDKEKMLFKKWLIENK